MEGLRGRIAGLVGALVAIVGLLVAATPTLATTARPERLAATPAAAPAAGAPPSTSPVAASVDDAASDTVALERDFVALLNDLRAAEGLDALEVHDGLTDVARTWASSMAAAGAISHRTDLVEVAPHPDWIRIGENVGVGASVVSLHDAFVASRAHYENMIDPEWHLVGVGVVVEPNGTIYVAVNFLEVQK